MLRGIRRRVEFTPTIQLVKRFLERVDASHGPQACWPYLGCDRGNGYGAIKHERRVLSSHCVAYVLAYGEIPVDSIVAHKCDNRGCCNPAHLEAITPGKNNQDADRRLGRDYARGEAAPTSVLTEPDVKAIRNLASGGLGYIRIARELGFNPNTVKNVVYRRTWKHIA